MALALQLGGLAVLAQGDDRRVQPAGDPGGARRLALVVGNAKYQHLNSLGNPVNDANAVAAALRDTGFAVTEGTDLTREGLGEAIDRFVGETVPGDVALFYYAGHGMEVRGVNYLIPVDFSAQLESQVPYRAIAAQSVLDSLSERGASFKVVVLDACRDNPLPTGRSGAGGWAAMPGGEATYIAFATQPGAVAADNRGEANGLFTKHFVAGLRQPGVELDTLLDQVTARVAQDSQGRQRPWKAGSKPGPFYFRPPTQGAPAAAPAPTAEADFDIADLAGAAAAMDDRLRKMRAAKAAVEQLEQKVDLAPQPKVQAWQRFLTTFEQDDAATTADDAMRAYAIGRIGYWREQGASAAQSLPPAGPPGPPTENQGERPGTPREGSGLSWLGIGYQDLTPSLRQSQGIPDDVDGVWIHDVFPSSVAFRQLVRQGDVIREVNGQPTRSVSELEAKVGLVGKGAYLRLWVGRFDPRLGRPAEFFVVFKVP